MAYRSPSALPPIRTIRPIAPRNRELIIENDYTIKKFQKLGYLHSIKKRKSHTLTTSYIVTEPSLKSFKTLRRFASKNTRKTNLFFYSLTNNHVAYIKSFLAISSSLSTLKIAVRTAGDLTDGSMRMLNRSIAKLRGLKTLSIGFIEDSQITKSAISHFFQNVSYLPTLKTLKFRIYECDSLTSTALENVARYLIRLSQLENLALDFSSCREIDDACLTTLGNSFQRLASIRSLNVQLKGCYSITDAGLLALGASISVIHQLTGFGINVDSCFELTDLGVTELMRSVAGIGGLTWLKLVTVDGPTFTNRSIETMGEIVETLEELKTLEISIGSWQAGNTVCDEGVSKLMGAIGRVRRLRCIKLQFYTMSQFSDFCVETIGEKLSVMPRLEDVMIKFGRCRGISRRGICQLEKRLASCRNLVSVDVKNN